jgi:predicted GIY-YIG superfamily endonuclease
MSTNGFPAPDTRGVVYLVHFSGRTKQGHQHYLGFSSDLEWRYRQHRLGWGANETKKAIAEGLKLTVAQTWEATPALERRLKEWSKEGRKGFAGICPCVPEKTICRQISHGTWANRPCGCIAQSRRDSVGRVVRLGCPHWTKRGPLHWCVTTAVAPFAFGTTVDVWQLRCPSLVVAVRSAGSSLPT